MPGVAVVARVGFPALVTRVWRSELLVRSVCVMVHLNSQTCQLDLGPSALALQRYVPLLDTHLEDRHLDVAPKTPSRRIDRATYPLCGGADIRNVDGCHLRAEIKQLALGNGPPFRTIDTGEDYTVFLPL